MVSKKFWNYLTSRHLLYFEHISSSFMDINGSIQERLHLPQKECFQEGCDKVELNDATWASSPLQKEYELIKIHSIITWSKHSAAWDWKSSSSRRRQSICKSLPSLAMMWLIETHSTNPVKVSNTTCTTRMCLFKVSSNPCSRSGVIALQWSNMRRKKNKKMSPMLDVRAWYMSRRRCVDSNVCHTKIQT